MKRKSNILSTINDFFNTQPPPGFDKFAAYCSIVGLALTLLSFFGLDYSSLCGEPRDILSLFLAWWKNRGCRLAMVWILIMLLITIIKYRSSTIIKMNAISNGLSHIMVKTEEIIDNINEIGKVTDIKSCETCNYACKMSRKWLMTSFSQYTIAFLDELSQVMTDYVSYDVSACVKLIVDCVGEEKNLNSSQNLNSKRVVTFARNCKSNEGRNKVLAAEPVSIEQNSDFYDIINGEKAAYFYVPNLKTYSRKIAEISDGRHIYLNSTPNWWDYYIGTVVVPIGHAKSQNNRNGFTVWGFLCIDSLDDRAFTWKQKDINVKLLQGFANIYSLAVKEYESKLNKLMESEGEKSV